MDMHLRNGKVVQAPLEPSSGMPNLVAPSKETAGHPIESKRAEPGRDTSQPAAGIGRPIPRNRDRDAGGRKDYEMNQAWMDQGMADTHRQNAAQTAQGSGQAPQRAIGYEDGRNMRNFLDLAEIDFVERGVEARQWGDELKRYLTGDALGYWLYLYRTGASLTDWDSVRQQFCARFCSMTKERMKVMIAENVWQGDHNEYSARFAAIVAQGITMAPDLLVGYYLANLPDDLYREITRGGTRKFLDWQEAAAALATTAAPWRDSCEERLRFQRELEDAKCRQANGGRGPDLQRGRVIQGNRRNDTTESRCYKCNGRGHMGRDCPLRNGVERRPGEMCVLQMWGTGSLR